MRPETAPVSQHEKALEIYSSVKRVIVGKDEEVFLFLSAFFGRGHVLIEDLPGTGKTTLARALARALELSFARIQFTSDLLPSDIIGVNVFDSRKGEFEFRKGPIFANIVLADEINRATPKTQSALLEAMSEEQVTVDGVTYHLSTPFFVIATQNPFEQHGTYPLPESQLDRFMLWLNLGYPSREDEIKIIENDPAERVEFLVQPVADADTVKRIIQAVERVSVSEKILGYIMDIVEKTRTHPEILIGASTRAGIHLRRASAAFAFLKGRDFVTPDDVKAVAPYVLKHRLVWKRWDVDRFDSRAAAIRSIIDSVCVPL